MKKIVTPLLLVGGFNEIQLLKWVKNFGEFEFDVMVYYDYQRKHFNLIFQYIQPELYDTFPLADTYEDTLKNVREERYKARYEFMLVKFLQENEYDKDKMREWLNSHKEVMLYQEDVDVLRYYDLRKYYQSIVIDLDVRDGNKWNRFYDLPPNLFNDDVIHAALDHLSVGGLVFFINETVNRMWDFINVGYEELEPNIFKKKKILKKRKELPKRKWL